MPGRYPEVLVTAPKAFLAKLCSPRLPAALDGAESPRDAPEELCDVLAVVKWSAARTAIKILFH